MNDITLPQLMAFAAGLIGAILVIIMDAKEDLRNANSETQNYLRQIIQKDTEDNKFFRQEIKDLQLLFSQHQCCLKNHK